MKMLTDLEEGILTGCDDKTEGKYPEVIEEAPS